MASRKANKEKTRQKLVEATLRVLYQHGRPALTTGRIAEAAGVAQPTFYVHFRDMDDALTQAADAVAERLLRRLRDYRQDLGRTPSLEGVRGVYAASVKALLREPKMAALFLRHRRDASSPLGRRWAEITEQAREDLIADMVNIGLGAILPSPRVYAEMIVGLALSIVEAALDERLEDLDGALDELAMLTHAGLQDALRRHQQALQGKAAGAE